MKHYKFALVKKVKIAVKEILEARWSRKQTTEDGFNLASRVGEKVAAISLEYIHESRDIAIGFLRQLMEKFIVNNKHLQCVA
uniref:HD_domain domain-containing protein n=1 Tax=Panagrellus redivivus TaxID=6233 RepID=A0A7E4UPM9_PANRE